MNPDQTPDELTARIAAISVSAPADHIDIDEAVRAGTKRRRRRRLATAGAFTCVVALAGSVAVATQAGHDQRDTMATPTFGRAALTANDLGGRWIAVRVQGRDISSWRDVSGIPANIIIGADGEANAWQVNTACGPLVGGDFTLGTDGSFTATVPPRRFQSCPRLATPPPDLPEAMARTAYVAVDAQGDARGRTLRFLDSHKRLIALWREDTAISSRAAMTSVCKKALGRESASNGTFTTVEHVRAKHLAATNAKSEDVLPDVPGGTIAVRCSATDRGSPARYAVTVDGHKVRLRPVM
ncbi:hypothetical protein [Streptomyces olivochromogenes]|uniref:hypothetical protein n=1 Tax=Streptomyces olivochromogenes TaxID=1963 RepID=UPI001F2B712C|nr:hypothetical protein [Streptomyces olivochromogenes]MCF3131539.1 hypothetical protein [Streptomyces olivochromogenes]